MAHRIVETAGCTAPSGFVLLIGLTNPHLGVEFKRIVVTSKGAGIGRSAVRAVKAWAFLEHGTHRLWLEVKTFNARARALYTSEGFREEGTLRDCIRAADRWEPLIVMSMLAPEYHPGRSPGTVGAP